IKGIGDEAHVEDYVSVNGCPVFVPEGKHIHEHRLPEGYTGKNLVDAHLQIHGPHIAGVDDHMSHLSSFSQEPPFFSDAGDNALRTVTLRDEGMEAPGFAEALDQHRICAI